MKRQIQSLLARFGFALIRTDVTTPDMDPGYGPIRAAAKDYSLTSVSAMFALYKAVDHLVRNDIAGNFAECGVWRGGSAMAMALTLKSLGARPRDIFLFDTFAGMTPAGPEDSNVKTGESAAELLRAAGGSRDSAIVAYAGLEEVRANMGKTSYPPEHIHYIRGDVADTLAATDTGPLALLRLDTDWYASTKCELEVLYPRLVSGGVLIIDDYGSWSGARKAVDEFIESRRLRLLLVRADAGMRIAVKP